MNVDTSILTEILEDLKTGRAWLRQDRFHEILYARGITQKDLAGRLGGSEKTVSKWRNHNQGISPIHLVMLVHILDVEPSTLVEPLPSNCAVKEVLWSNKVEIAKRQHHKEVKEVVIITRGMPHFFQGPVIPEFSFDEVHRVEGWSPLEIAW